MSYTTISTATRDDDLLARVESAVSVEAWNGTNASSVFAEQVRNSASYGVGILKWPVAIDTEAAYASALAAGNPAPGLDPSVITDQAILSAVQAHWPDNPEGA